MKYPNAFRGVKKIFAAELLNTFASAVWLGAALFIAFVGHRSVSDGVALGVLFFTLAAGAAGLAAFFVMMAGLSQARRDDELFKTAFAFVIVCIVSTAVSLFTAGTFSNIFSGVNEVAALLVSVNTILGIYKLALEFKDERVLRTGKLTTVVVTAVFASAVAARLIGVFTPAVDEFFDVVCSVLELFGYAVFTTYLALAKRMLAAVPSDGK